MLNERPEINGIAVLPSMVGLYTPTLLPTIPIYPLPPYPFFYTKIILAIELKI
jgi:hypothetical protein